MVTTEPGLRNLDELQEDDERRTPRGVTLVLFAVGGACVVFAALALGGRSGRPQAARPDPLGDLLAHHAASVPSAGMKPTDLQPKDVTFPETLSDQGRPTTALAAVRSGASVPASAAAPEPPPPTDRLPVVPLPAQALLEATPVITRPRDPLTKAASEAAQVTTPPSTEAAPVGHEGAYQLQVSSFRAQGDADTFADQLRARGHRAYVVEARVPGRGTWYRVRIGPFMTQHAATQYRAAFEAREHVVPFLVTPDPAEKSR